MFTAQESPAETSFAAFQTRSNDDRLLIEITQSFAERVASSNLLDPEVRDSRTNPRVLEHRVQKEKEYSRRFKLKYKEQLAKKEFFGLLLSDPERITHEDNEAFLQSNLRAKADLKATKSDLERYYAGINENSLRVESRVEIVKAKLVQGSRTIQAIKEMKRELAMLRATLPAHKRMTLPQLNDTLEAQDAQLVALNEEESSVKERIAVEKTSLSQLVKRLEGLGPERVKAESTARQLQASAADQKAEIMELCGWNRGVIELYSRLFDVQTLVAASENELQIPYAGEPPYTLSLVFNPATRRLGTAQVLGYDEDISELVELAVDSDDIAGLIRDVRAHVQRSSAAMAKDEPSAYDVLGIKSDVSDSDLQKAYRQRSLKVHPDRNPDLPDAAQKFHELTQAYELLRDPTRRSALDATLRLKEARKTRFAAYDSKRRALQEELEESERAFKKSRTAKAQQEQTEQQNLDLIQEQGRKLKKEMEEKRERGRTDGGGPITTAQGPPIGPLDSTVRLKYSNLDVPNLTSAAALSSFLQPFGSTDADSIVLSIKPRKKKSTGDGAIVTALVPFQSVRDAFAVVVSSKVGPLKRIESSWAGGEEPDIIRWLKREGKLTSGNAEPARLSGKSALLSDTPTFFPSFPDSIERASSSKNNHISSRPLDYESITLMRLRQAEREKLERDIRESEA